jgi:hypothetical protein
MPDDTADVPVSGLRAGAAAADDDAWAVGFFSMGLDGRGLLQPLVEHWDGRTWRRATTPHVGANAMLTGVAAAASDAVWAVGSYSEGRTDIHALIERWDGQQWAVVASPDISVNHALTAIAARSARDIWAVGWQARDARRVPLVEHWDGRQWAIVAVPENASDSGLLNAVAAGRPNSVWVAGDSTLHGSGFAMHWDGSQWTRVDVPGARTLTGIGVLGSADVWIVGASSSRQPFVARWNGTTWITSVVNAPPGTLRAIAPIARTDAWTVGDTDNDTLSFHYSGCLGRRQGTVHP